MKRRDVVRKVWAARKLLHDAAEKLPELGGGTDTLDDEESSTL